MGGSGNQGRSAILKDMRVSEIVPEATCRSSLSASLFLYNEIRQFSHIHQATDLGRAEVEPKFHLHGEEQADIGQAVPPVNAIRGEVGCRNEIVAIENLPKDRR